MAVIMGAALGALAFLLLGGLAVGITELRRLELQNAVDAKALEAALEALYRECLSGCNNWPTPEGWADGDGRWIVGPDPEWKIPDEEGSGVAIEERHLLVTASASEANPWGTVLGWTLRTLSRQATAATFQNIVHEVILLNPQVVVLLDYSASMTWKISGGTETAKSVLVEALKEALTNDPANPIYVGLGAVFFGGEDGPLPNGVVPIAQRGGSAGAIRVKLDGLPQDTSGNTRMAESLRHAAELLLDIDAGDLGGDDDNPEGLNRYIFLVTDGAPRVRSGEADTKDEEMRTQQVARQACVDDDGVEGNDAPIAIKALLVGTQLGGEGTYSGTTSAAHFLNSIARDPISAGNETCVDDIPLGENECTQDNGCPPDKNLARVNGNDSWSSTPAETFASILKGFITFDPSSQKHHCITPYLRLSGETMDRSSDEHLQAYLFEDNEERQLIRVQSRAELDTDPATDPGWAEDSRFVVLGSSAARYLRLTDPACTKIDEKTATLRVRFGVPKIVQ